MRPTKRGFTLVELLVVIAIIGVLMATTVPAVLASREAGRRAQCQSNLSQIAMALQSYENAHEAFPAGVIDPQGPIRSQPQGMHQGWLISLLPYLDESNAYRTLDFSASVYAPANAAVRDYWPHVLFCSSEPDDVAGASSYAGCHHDAEAPIAADNRGVLFLNSRIRREDVTDGVSHTLFLGEKRTEPGDLGWLSGTRATLRNTSLTPNEVTPLPSDADAAALAVGTFGSAHIGGVLIALGDGGVRFVAEEIDPRSWQQLGDRADSKLLKFPPPGAE